MICHNIINTQIYSYNDFLIPKQSEINRLYHSIQNAKKIYFSRDIPCYLTNIFLKGKGEGRGRGRILSRLHTQHRTQNRVQSHNSEIMI